MKFAFSKPSSHVVKYSVSTIPEPRPPLTVFLAPEPINKTLQGFCIGNSLFLFKNKVNSAEFFCKKLMVSLSILKFL